MSSFVVVKFPRTGLGNMLLIWARAKIFASKNDLPLITPSWTKIHYGAWLRNETHKRMYWGYFKRNSFNFLYAISKLFLKEIKERNIQAPTNTKRHKAYIFNEIYIDKHLFKPLWTHREFIKNELYTMLHTKVLQNLNHQSIPTIAIHVRRGDFKYGNPITSNDFFIKNILFVRGILKKTLPVTVFSDAEDKEIDDILRLPSVERASNNSDIVDILLMSKAKILILSRSSTFSYWGAFLSDAVVIRPDGDWQESIRPESVNKIYFEGKINTNDPSSYHKLQTYLIENKHCF